MSAVSEAGFTRHQHVQQNEVRLLGAAQAASGGAVAGSQGAEALGLQDARDQLQVGGRVVDDENGWRIHRGALLLARQVGLPGHLEAGDRAGRFVRQVHHCIYRQTLGNALLSSDKL
jgi:hypothetical protein